MNNQFYFHGREFKNAIINDLNEIFNGETVTHDLNTYVYMMKNSSELVDSLSLPCILVTIPDAPNSEKHQTNTEIQQFTNFVVAFDIYSNDIGNYVHDEAVEYISEILISQMQKKYHNFVVTMNKPLPNLDSNIARHMVQIKGVFDNKYNFIYSN